MSKSENPFVCFLPQLPSLLPGQLFLGPEKLTTQKHLISYTSGKLITDINQNLLIAVLEMEKVFVISLVS